MLSKHIILSIDDDKDDLDTLQFAFQRVAPSYEIREARDGEAGFELLMQLVKEGTIPCLIILDINMPKMDGRETFKKIRSEPSLSHIPIVIFSTSTSLLDKTYFNKLNVAYFVKPIDMNQFYKVVRNFLKHCENS